MRRAPSPAARGTQATAMAVTQWHQHSHRKDYPSFQGGQLSFQGSSPRAGERQRKAQVLTSLVGGGGGKGSIKSLFLAPLWLTNNHPHSDTNVPRVMVSKTNANQAFQD